MNTTNPPPISPEEHAANVAYARAYIKNGGPPEPEGPPPLPAGTTGAAVLDEVATFIRRYVAMPSDASVDAVALFIAHTHGIEAADTTPYLHINSPEKRAGKTVLMDVITPLVGAPLPAVSASAAAIYRGIVEDGTRRTLILDEVDTVFSAKGSEQAEALRQVLNAGTRRGAVVIRHNQNTGRNDAFDPFGPKVIGGIHEVPDTLADRCISISMMRAAPEEVAALEPARYRTLKEHAEPLHARIAAWVGSVEDRAATARPDPVPGLSSRSMDAWEPLLALAALAGGDWPDRANAAALRLSYDDPEALSQDTMYRRCLIACHELMGEHEKFVPSEELVDRLKAHDEEWRFLNHTGISPKVLGRILGRYKVKAIRGYADEGDRRRGYQRMDVAEAHGVWITRGVDKQCVPIGGLWTLTFCTPKRP
jgi:hypothetical protein